MRRVLPFYALACGVTWLCWLPLVAFARGWSEGRPSPYWHLIGGLGPALAAITIAALSRDGALRRLLARLVSRPSRWVVLAVVGPVALYLGAALVVTLLGGEVDLAQTGANAEYPGLGLGAFVIANVLFYGVGEELGWRGFALPRLQRSMSPVRASLVIAVGWAAWHLPLFVFSGMSTMGAASVFGWLGSIVAGSFLMTWLWNASGGSVLAVAVFHGVLDVLINSPVGGALQSTMGALVTVAGLTTPFRLVRAPRVVDG